MPPRGAPLGSARQALSSKPSLAFSLIQSLMVRIFPFRSSTHHEDVTLSRDRESTGRAAPASTSWTRRGRRALRDGYAADDERERQQMVTSERLAEQADRHQRAEQRHEVHEHPGAAGADQLDAAHIEDLRQEGWAERGVDQQEQAPACRPDEFASCDLGEEQ